MIRMSFGAKFKHLREAKGIPRAGVDELFNLMPGTVSNWWNGFREPEEELLPELASFFGVRIKELIIKWLEIRSVRQPKVCLNSR